MKSLYLILILYFFSLTKNYAQVGVGTTNPDATLDIRSSNENAPSNADGILIPKINNFPTTSPTAAQDGMMVYVTGSGTPAKGFYYWDNSISNWVTVNSISGWQETGNAGTNPTTNFIGTTDTQDLSFRTNNVEKMRLTGKGQLEFLNTGGSVFIGEGAGENDDLANNRNTFVGTFSGNDNSSGSSNSFFGFLSGSSNTNGDSNSFFGSASGNFNTLGVGNSFFGNFSGQLNTTGNFNSFFGRSSGAGNTTGEKNSFFGYFSGLNNTTGEDNSFIGYFSGVSNTTGISNSFIGSFSGRSNTTGNNNSFVGANSGFSNTTGVSNSFIGSLSGQNNTTGSNNVFLGTSSGRLNTIGNNNVGIGNTTLQTNAIGSNNVAIGREAGRGTSNNSKNNGIFIGYQAGLTENNDNRLYIESSSSTNPLIYGEFDTDILRVNGILQVNNPTLTGYAFPNTDGTANQVLQTDGNGTLTFVQPNTLDTNDWNRNGNGGTNPTTNFIGTTDAQDLSFRTNNIEKLQLTQQGQLEFLNTGNSVFIGENSGANDDFTDNFNTYVGHFSGRISGADGEYNSYFGAHAGEETVGFFNSYFGSFAGSASGGENNTYLGYRAGANSGSGFSVFIGSRAGELGTDSNASNVFIGADSASNFTEGSENVAIGSLTLNNAFGYENVVIGSRALQLSADTNNSVVIGAQAAENVPAIAGSVIIGNQVGRSSGVISNKLFINNEDSSSPLIYGEFDNLILGFNADVGIGHQSPQAPLHVKGLGNPNTQNIVGVLESSDTSRPILLFSESPTISLNSGMSIEYNGTGNNTTNKLVFNGIGGNALYEFENGGNLTALAGDINIASGDLVIETVPGDREIRMGDNAGNNDRVMLRQAGTDHIFIGDIDNNGGNFTVRTGGANAMTILSGSRNVGIGLANPNFRLQISTNSAAKPTSQLWTVVSDRRLKKDVRAFTDGLETLKQIEPIWFTYNGLADMPNETGVGTIAQQLEEVAPYLVKDWEFTSKEGNTETYKAVDYGPLTFIMVNAIKEQAQEITRLTLQLETQQSDFDEKIRLLEERLTRLEN